MAFGHHASFRPRGRQEISQRRQKNSLWRRRRLAESAQKWDPVVYRILERLARSAWPDHVIMGVIPVHSYRFKRRISDFRYLWWVEHDLSEFDRFRFEAYIAELRLDERRKPALFLHTREAIYRLDNRPTEELKTIVELASQDPPKRIPRRNGIARGD